MPSPLNPKYYLVESSMVPEIFIKVTKAKELLETGEAATVAEAVSKIGISRSAFYKYKDSVAPFLDMKRGQIITFHLILRNKKGLLSSVLWAFADSGANILTINQSIPINGTASVTISAESEGLKISTEELLLNLRSIDGLLKTEVIAG